MPAEQTFRKEESDLAVVVVARAASDKPHQAIQREMVDQEFLLLLLEQVLFVAAAVVGG